jgi:hypothetical protein
MVDVANMPENAFGYVPTPAIVAPLEFTTTKDEYIALGGHAEQIRSVADIIKTGGEYSKDSQVLSVISSDHDD